MHMKKEGTEARSRSLNLTDNEKRDIVKYLEAGKALPDKYRFLLFGDDREVELIWNGKNNEVTNVVLPFQTIEQIDEPREGGEFGNSGTLFDTSGRQITGWTNKLIWGDNKLILSSLKNGPLRKEIEAQGGLKLVYIDPPFDVGADFSMNIEIGEGDEAESFTKKPSVIEEVAYRDTWGKGADSFVAMIYERLKLIHDLLAEDGSVYVHCDWRVNSYMRLILDEIFGKDNQTGEIVWNYSWGLRTETTWNRKHDTILMYSKNKEGFIFNANSVLEERKMSEATANRLKYKGALIKDGNKGRGTEEKALPSDVWYVATINGMSIERLGYPTQKPEELIEKIILASSNKGDLIADFFCGSGTTLSVAEKLGRKWIGSDLGKFGVHTTRKRMIGVQRELKKAGKDFRAFEILNVGKYERESFLNTNDDLRAEEKEKQAVRKEQAFVKLILSAYKAEAVESFSTIVGKKRDRLVAIGPINLPVSQKFIQELVQEMKTNNISKVDVLGFDYEMGLIFDDFVTQGVDIAFKIIPREVFDKRAVERGQVNFYDVAYIEAKPIIEGRGNMKTVSIELSDFSVSYNQDSGAIDEELKGGKSKIIVESGQVLKVTKDKETGEVTRELLTKKWSDWIDYWAVDYNFADRKEIIKVLDGEQEKEVWTGDYIFDNEWQSFRTKKNRNLELVSAPVELPKGDYKVAVKVVDIFGNDTTQVIDVKL
jgi:DNA modification methylase